MKSSEELSSAFFLAFKSIRRCFHELAETQNLAPAQLAALEKLWVKDGLSISELGGKLGLNTSTVTSLLDRMERDKLVFRERSREDRRIVNIYLTPGAVKLKNKLPHFEDILMAKLERKLSPNEIKQLVELLLKIHSVLEECV